MDQTKRIRISQTDDAGEIPATEGPEIIYPENFANTVGWLAAINTAIDNVVSEYSSKGINARNIILQNNIRDQLFMKFIGPLNSTQLTNTKNTLAQIGWPDIFNLNNSKLPAVISSIEENAPENDMNSKDIANQINGFVTNIQPTKNVESEIKNNQIFKKQVSNFSNQGDRAGFRVRQQSSEGLIIISQQLQQENVITPVPPVENVNTPVQTNPLDSNPLSVDKFNSIEDLKNALIQMGPKAETYNRIFELVGTENEDSAKESLAKFFQGSPAGLYVIYDLLVKAGVANPVDEQIVGELMNKYPEVFDDKQPEPAQVKAGSLSGSYILEASNGKTVTVKNDWDLMSFAEDIGWNGQGDYKQFIESQLGKTVKVAGYFGSKHQEKIASFNGLYIPPKDASVLTMEKTASGFLGGVSDAPYMLSGPQDQKMCPKVRTLVPTYICRYHCLDGLAIADHQILCGEAIWRRHVMDKFSTEYVDKDGKLTGGYIRERFQVDSNTHEHPALLKPGQRHAPINEDAWSTEKRLQEMRREESKDRGYCETPGDPKNVYNFDQHDLAKGPENPQLSEKKLDPIAANSNKEIKTAFSMHDPLGENTKLTAGEECPNCKKKFKEGTRFCPSCKVKTKIYYKSDALRETGTVEPVSNAFASKANGVWKVVRGNEIAFGSTVREALSKLAPETPDTVNKINEELTDIVQDNNPQPQITQVQPINQQQKQVFKSPVLEQENNAVLTENPTPIIPQDGQLVSFNEGEDLLDFEEEDEPHVGAGILDSHLGIDDEALDERKDRTAEFEQYGLGPAKNKGEI